VNGGRPGPASVVLAAGHLAVWLGLYFAGAYIGAVLVLDRPVLSAAVVASFCAGVGLYLLDRVKVRDAWLDPADRMAQPGRFAFLLARRGRVRAVAWSLLAVGSVAAMTIDRRNLVLPVLGVIGIISYSRMRPGGVRPKDVLGLKNLLPGAAIGGLALVLAWQTPGAPAPVAAWAWLAGGLTLLITADAALCDLDDAAADAAHGTRTVTTRLGRRWTWAIALAAHALAGAALVAAGVLIERVREPALLGGVNLAATVVLCSTRPGSVRDLIDLKLPAVVAIAWAAR
jgi:4-hydroxybenzoate polyprenyltransferase